MPRRATHVVALGAQRRWRHCCARGAPAAFGPRSETVNPMPHPKTVGRARPTKKTPTQAAEEAETFPTWPSKASTLSDSTMTAGRRAASPLEFTLLA